MSLNTTRPVGFWWAEDHGNPHPDAWCTNDVYGEVKTRNIEKVQWWLMWCDFPNRNGRACEFTPMVLLTFLIMDGRTSKFPNEEAAIQILAEDEYTELSVDEEDEKEPGVPLASLARPSGISDKELLPNMYAKAE